MLCFFFGRQAVSRATNAQDVANTPDTTYTLTGLKPNTHYTFGVGAQNAPSGHTAISFTTKAS